MKESGLETRLVATECTKVHYTGVLTKESGAMTYRRVRVWKSGSEKVTIQDIKVSL
jgi:hypothetical protein